MWLPPEELKVSEAAGGYCAEGWSRGGQAVLGDGGRGGELSRAREAGEDILCYNRKRNHSILTI